MEISRTPGNVENQLQIGFDPVGDVAPDYDITSLQVAQSSGFWYFGFHVPSSLLKMSRMPFILILTTRIFGRY